MTLSWDDPDDASITGYQVWRGPTATSLVELVANTGSASAGYVDATAEAGTSYAYAVSAINANGASQRSQAVSVTTLEAVAGLTLESLTPGELGVEWTAPSPAPTDYQVSWARSGQAFAASTDSSANALPTSASHSITGLTAGVEYKVRVRARYAAGHARGTGSGPWSAEVVQRVDDYPDDADTAGEVTIGESVDAWIASGGDVDWLAADLQAGQGYDVTLEGDEELGAQLIGVYDDQEAVVRDGVEWSGSTALVFTPETAGTYYVSVAGTDEETGSYTLSVDEVPEGTVTGVRLSSGTVGELTIAWNAPSPPPTDYRVRWARESLEYLNWRDANEAQRGNEYPAGTTTSLTLSGLTPAAAYKVMLRARYNGGDYRNRPWSGPWTAEVAGRVKEQPAGTDTTERVAPDDPATGEIDYGGDRDWFAVELQTGRTYRFDLEGSATDAGTLSDPYLWGIHDSQGRLIDGTADNNHGEDENARVTFTATDGGTYYVAAGANGSDTGTYSLKVTDLAGTIRISDAEADETDGVLRFRVTLDAASEQTVTVRYATENGTAVAGEAYESASGVLEFAPGDTEKHVEVVLIDDTVEDTGETVILRLSDAVGALLADSQGTGTIRNSDPPATASEGETDLAEATDTAGRVRVGESATGEIDEGGDRDWFAVTLEAGKTYRFDLEGSGTNAGTLRDPYLRGIYNSEGDYIGGTSNNNSGTGRNSRVVFTAETAGTYYVSAGAYSSEIGTYKLSATRVADDDYAAGTDTAGTVAVGGPATGDIEQPGDQDWFAVELEAGKAYRIDLEGSGTNAGTLRDPYLRGIHGSQGNYIGSTDDDDGSGRNSRVVFITETAGTYYVSAGAHSSEIGTYKLSVTDVTDAHAAGTGTAGMVAVGGSATGDIEQPSDQDWFAVELEAGKAYRIDLEGSGTNAGTLLDPYLRGIYDSEGNRIVGTSDNDDGTGRNSRVVFITETAGTYYVSAGAYGGKMGTYKLSVMEIPDLAAGTSTTGTVAVGGPATEDIEQPGDQDWFAVELEAGKAYRIDLEGSDTNAGTLRDPYLRGIYDSEGNRIVGTSDNDDGTGRNSRVVFITETAGTYYVSAGASGGKIGTYKLSVMEIPDDHAAGTGTAGMVAVGGSATGQVNFQGDRDWFAVTLEAGRTYRFDLQGSATNAGTLHDPHLRGIHDSQGNYIGNTSDNDAGTLRNSRVFFTADIAGTYYVSTGANRDIAGTYKLSVTDVTDDDHTAGTGTSGTVAVGSPATGDIERSGDRDWFAVMLEAGKSYRIDLEGLSTDVGTLHDPNLRIHDSEGNYIDGTSNDDGGVGNNSLVYFTAETAGTYYVSAGAYTYEYIYESWQIGTYKLSLTEVANDIAAGIGTTGTVAVGGSVTGDIEHPDDRDWFAVELESDKAYRFDLEGWYTSAGTLDLLYLHGIFNSRGNPLDGTQVLDGLIYFVPPTAGTYYVSAGSNYYRYHPWRDRIGSYELSVKEVPDDLAASTGTTGTVAVGGSATGEINFPGDRDWFAVELEKGKAYRIDLEGSGTNAGTLRDPYLRGIYDSEGHYIGGSTDDDDGTGRNSRVVFTAETAGTYYVSAGTSYGSGTYKLSVTEVADDDHAAGTNTTGMVGVDGSATGEINFPGDRDWFAVELDAHRLYLIGFKGAQTDAGTLGDPSLYGVYDSGGKRVSRHSPFVTTYTGTYYISAGAVGTGTGTYTLAIKAFSVTLDLEELL